MSATLQPDPHAVFGSYYDPFRQTYAFRGMMAAGVDKYNLLIEGDAPNFFAGSLLIGADAKAPKIKLDANGTASANSVKLDGGTLASGVGSLTLSTTGGDALVMIENGTPVVNQWLMIASRAGDSVFLRAMGSDANVNANLQSRGAGQIVLSTNGNAGGAEGVRITHVASAVNYWDMRGSPTDAGLNLLAGGPGANIGMNIFARGTGVIDFGNGGGKTRLQVNDTGITVGDGTYGASLIINSYTGQVGGFWFKRAGANAYFIGPMSAILGTPGNADMAIFSETGHDMVLLSNGSATPKLRVSPIGITVQTLWADAVATGFIKTSNGTTPNLPGGDFGALFNTNSRSMYLVWANGVTNSSAMAFALVQANGANMAAVTQLSGQASGCSFYVTGASSTVYIRNDTAAQAYHWAYLHLSPSSG